MTTQSKTALSIHLSERAFAAVALLMAALFAQFKGDNALLRICIDTLFPLLTI
jgi:hypothetical protein